MTYPKVYLVLDNCFAIKRWVRPAQWMPVVKDTGFSWVEASTDNEFDPLFATEGYMNDWLEEVEREGKRLGLRVANFFTGYQTYRTVGFAHHDERIRELLVRGWHQVLIRKAARLNAGIGFSFWAFPEEVLQEPEAYERTTRMILDTVAQLARQAREEGVALSAEQMYAPHQPPWTIRGSRRYLKDLYALSGVSSYVTIDVGHQVGQDKFTKPGREKILSALRSARKGHSLDDLWLGPRAAFDLFGEAAGRDGEGDEAAADAIVRLIDDYPYLFSEEGDGDTYAWLEQLGCYSPIVHMQQTDGVTSSHAPFTEDNNRRGIISGDRVLRAIKASFDAPAEEAMPPKCGSIFLSFELFAANTDYNAVTIRRLRETCEYWRRFVPEDGVPLDQLV